MEGGREGGRERERERERERLENIIPLTLLRLISPVTLKRGDHEVETVDIVTALVTENISLTLSTLGSQMEPMKVPMPADRLKPLSVERHVPGGSTVTVTACVQSRERVEEKVKSGKVCTQFYLTRFASGPSVTT